MIIDSAVIHRPRHVWYAIILLRQVGDPAFPQGGYVVPAGSSAAFFN